MSLIFDSQEGRQLSGHFPLSPIARAISRYFLSFDPLVKTHGVLASPVTFTGDFKISMLISGGVSSGAMLVSGGTTAGGFEIYKTGDGGISIWHSGISKGGNPIVITDGMLNRIVVKRVGTGVELYLNDVYLATALNVSGDCIITNVGCRTGGSFYFDGLIADLEFSGDNFQSTKLALDKTPPIHLYKYSVDLATVSASYFNTGWSESDTKNYSIDGTNTVTSKAGFTNIELGKTYTFHLKLSNHISGSFRINTNTANSSTLSGNGEVLWDYTASNSSWGLQAIGANCQFDIEIVSVKEVINYQTIQAAKNTLFSESATFGENIAPLLTEWLYDSADDWSLDSGRPYCRNAVSGGQLSSSVLMPELLEGNLYLVEIDLEWATLDQGRLALYVGGTWTHYLNSYSDSPNKLYALVIPANSLGGLQLRSNDAGGGIFNGWINSMTIREVTGNAINMSGLYIDQQNKYTLKSSGWLGENLVIGSGFDNSLDWTQLGNWNVSDSMATGDEVTNTLLYQYKSFDLGTYLEELTVADYVSGTLQVSSGGAGTSVNSNGTFSELRLASADTFFRLAPSFSTGFVGSVLNVSRKRLIEVA